MEWQTNRYTTIGDAGHSLKLLCEREGEGRKRKYDKMIWEVGDGQKPLRLDDYFDMMQGSTHDYEYDTRRRSFF